MTTTIPLHQRLAEANSLLVNINGLLAAFDIAVEDNDYVKALLELRLSAVNDKSRAHIERDLVETRQWLQLTNDRLTAANEAFDQLEATKCVLLGKLETLEQMREEQAQGYRTCIQQLRSEVALLREENRKLRSYQSLDRAREA